MQLEYEMLRYPTACSILYRVPIWELWFLWFFWSHWCRYERLLGDGHVGHCLTGYEAV